MASKDENVASTPKDSAQKKPAPKPKLPAPMGKFWEDFNPETSNRKKRKLARKMYTAEKMKKDRRVYDEKGLLISNGKDVCDCLIETCPGCHFPCPKCGSEKCAVECRVNRKYMYDSYTIEPTGEVIKNKYK